jgi:hypothetical protein
MIAKVIGLPKLSEADQHRLGWFFLHAMHQMDLKVDGFWKEDT